MVGPELMREMHAEGQMKWPSLAVALEDFQRYCERMGENDDACANLRTNAADVYLCCACSKGDKRAVSIFEREAEEVVRGAIARVHRDPEFIRETLQEF